jgi:hypothetical protein
MREKKPKMALEELGGNARRSFEGLLGKTNEKQRKRKEKLEKGVHKSIKNTLPSLTVDRNPKSEIEISLQFSMNILILIDESTSFFKGFPNRKA